MIIPLSWKPFVDLRRKGNRPEVPVIVSVVGNVKTDWPVLVVPEIPVDDVDFRVLVDLDVIVAHFGKNTGKLVTLADVLVREKVRNLEFWNILKDEWVSVLFHHEKSIRNVPSMEVPCA